MSGSSVAAPVWLKHQRKEGSVHVYEADDAMNWALIMTVVLTVSFPTEMGVSASAVSNTSQTVFSETLVQANQSAENMIHEAAETFGTEVIDSRRKGGEIVIPSGIICANKTFCEYGMSLYRGALSKEAVVHYQVVDSPPYNPVTKALGYKSVITLDLAAVNISKAQEDFLAVVTPTFDEETFRLNPNSVSAEMIIRVEGGSEYVQLRGYYLGEPVFITISDLLNRIDLPKELSSQKLEISIMPIDTSELFRDKSSEKPTVFNTTSLKTQSILLNKHWLTKGARK